MDSNSRACTECLLPRKVKLQTQWMHACMFHVMPTLWCKRFLKNPTVRKATVTCLTGKCEVPVGYKWRVFVMAWLSVPVWESKLCVLLLFFFPSAEPNHAPPSHPLAEARWDLYSHWLQDTPGRIQEPFFCLHAGREKPTNNCYLGQPGNLKLATQKRIMLEQSCMCARTHTHTHVVK